MKAIIVSQFGDESVLKEKDVSLPEPESGEVRVRIGAAGVNPVETYIRSGKYGNQPSLPYTPGTDGAGTVDAVGEGVSGISVGDRVFIAASLARRNTGTYAEFTVCDAGAVRPLPQAFSFDEGAGLGVPGLAAAYGLFSRGGLRPGETVLVNGATGGVGTLAVQLARQFGARVLATAGDEKGADLVRSLGASQVFNHHQDGYMKKVAEAEPDVIIEMIADVNLSADLAALKKHGRVVIVGSKGRIEIDPRETMAKDLAIHGILLSNMSPTQYSENMARLSAALANGLTIVVNQRVPLAEASRAHRLTTEGHHVGKIVLTISK